MRIGEFSNKTNTSIDTLRYYDKIGLLVPDRKNGIRVYNDDDIKNLEIIDVLKDMRYSLDDIKEIIVIDKKIDKGTLGTNEYEVSKLCEIVEKKYEEILIQQKSLKSARKKIEHIREKLDRYKNGGV